MRGVWTAWSLASQDFCCENITLKVFKEIWPELLYEGKLFISEMDRVRNWMKVGNMWK